MSNLLEILPYNLSNDIINIINSFNYGPLDITTANNKKNLNIEFTNSDIWLNIIDFYTKSPELEINHFSSLNEGVNLWFDYEYAQRIPKLID